MLTIKNKDLLERFVNMEFISDVWNDRDTLKYKLVSEKDFSIKGNKLKCRIN